MQLITFFSILKDTYKSFDVTIELDFKLIYLSEGMCITPPNGCEFEAGFRKRKKRGDTVTKQPLYQKNPMKRELLVADMAEQICQLYIDQALATAHELDLPLDEDTIDEILAACIFDTQITGDREVSWVAIETIFLSVCQVGSKSVQVLLAEGIHQLPPLNDTEFLMNMQTSISSAEEAISSVISEINVLIEEETGSLTMTTTSRTSTIGGKR